MHLESACKLCPWLSEIDWKLSVIVIECTGLIQLMMAPDCTLSETLMSVQPSYCINYKFVSSTTTKHSFVCLEWATSQYSENLCWFYLTTNSVLINSVWVSEESEGFHYLVQNVLFLERKKKKINTPSSFLLRFLFTIQVVRVA